MAELREEVLDATDRAPFGELLRRYRAVAGLTQEELGERAGVSARTIGDVERGVSRAPQRDTVRRLGEALGLHGDARSAFDAAGRRRVAAPIAQATQVPGSRLVGREPELALLDRHLTGDGPPILLLAGDPGIGKTTLLGEATQRALGGGWLVLGGGCLRRGSQEPFEPLAGALSGFLRRRPSAALRDDLRGCRWLARLLPELLEAIDEPLPGWAVPPEQERRLMFEAVGRLVENLAGRGVGGRVLFVLDDLQWAGSDALDLLGALLRPAAPRPVPRVVGAYRDAEVGPVDVLAVAMADWAHGGLVRHHALPPLGAEECGQLFDQLATANRAVRERVLQRAGGVPFFVVSYAHALRRGDVAGAVDGVPWDVAQGVRQRVAALPEAARAVLGAAAVAGRHAEPALLAAVVGRPEDDVLAGLDAAGQARLLLDDGGAYRFAHDLIHEVVAAELGSARRAALHRRAAAAVEVLHGADLAAHYETLAHHYLRGEAWEQALDYLARSGDKAARAHAIREALGHYDQALALCARLGAPVDAATAALSEQRGLVSFDAGDFVGATADFARMGAAAARLGDRRREGQALAYRGMAAYYAHEFEAAEAALRQALAVAGEELEDVRLFATVQLNSLLMIIGRHAEAEPLFRAADDLADRVEEPLSRAWWGICGSEVLHWSGRYDAALAHLARWREAVAASNQLVTLLWSQWETALTCGGKGEYARALALLDDVVALCRDTGEEFIQARALNTAGWIHGELQDHERALELNGRSLAVAAAIETADMEIANNARLNLGDSLAALGRLDEAETHYRSVERVVRDPRPQDRWMLWRYAQHVFHSLGELCLARGDADTALDHADECLRGAEATSSTKNVVKARRLRAEALLARGELGAAEAELGRALELARELGNPPQLWRTYASIGDLRSAEGQPAAACQAYADALAVVERVAAGLPHPRLRDALLGSAHVRRLREQWSSFRRGGS